METTVLKDIILFSKKVKGCKLGANILENKADYMLRIDAYFKTNRLQSILIIAVFDLNSEGKKPGISEIAKYLKCSAIELFVYNKAFLALLSKTIFKLEYTIFAFKSKRIDKYYISEIVKTAIIENKPYKPKPPKKLKPLDIANEAYKMINARYEAEVNTSELEEEFTLLLDTYSATDFGIYLKKLKFSNTCLMSFLYLIWHNALGNLACELPNLSNGIFSEKVTQIFFEKSIAEKKNMLVKANYFNVNDANYYNAITVSLTEKVKKELEHFKIPIRLQHKENDIKLLEPKSIVKKALYYNVSINAHIDTISQSLRPLKHKQIVRALKNEGYKTGICTLFYGVPGTGKTEGVYQIAKATGRSLWKVDLSALKSMWFGESQKLVKALFEDYKTLCKQEKRIPIMLLNEADAILGTRKPKTQSGSDKAENAIQNIFLDCLEDFEGILFATTNLEESLDTAFERRFLFKVNFEQPDLKSKRNIWQSKLKELSLEKANELAQKYDFSGGEIENVVRKFKLARVLNPEIDIEKQLIAFCESEKLNTKNNRVVVGF